MIKILMNVLYQDYGSIYRLGCRNLNTFNTFMEEGLADVVRDVYSSENYPQISYSQYELILYKILDGKYELSPIRVHNVKMIEFDDYCSKNSAKLNDFRYYPSCLPGYITVVRADDQDFLVLDALTELLLNTTIYGCNLQELLDDFHKDIQKMCGILRLYRIKIHVPFPNLSILEKLPRYSINEDTYVYHLIESFLNLPYVDDDGNDVSDIIGRPAVGGLSCILYIIVLQETFDREFYQLFPGVSVYRYLSLVIIGTKNQDRVVFNEKAGYALLMKLGMIGKIVSIGPGDDPIACNDRKAVSIENNLSKKLSLEQLYIRTEMWL